MRQLRQAGFGVSARGACRSRPGPLSGFSLIEALCVTAILLILAILLWNYASSPKPNRLKMCAVNLQKTYLALQIYANDFRDRYPVVAGAVTSDEALSLLVPHYTVDTGLFICPGTADPPLPSGEPFRGRRISYAFYMGQGSKDPQDPLMSDWQINSLLKAEGTQVFSTSGGPPGNNHQAAGGNFLFCDGSVQSTPPKIAFSLVVTQGVILLNPKL